jgi:predicted dinucleotide-binding enzyme
MGRCASRIPECRSSACPRNGSTTICSRASRVAEEKNFSKATLRLGLAVIRELVPSAHVVKAFNHLDVRVLPQPDVAGGKRTLFYSGDDAGRRPRFAR